MKLRTRFREVLLKRYFTGKALFDTSFPALKITKVAFETSPASVLDMPSFQWTCTNEFFRHVDAYHSCYALTGLSTAQHHHQFASPTNFQEEGFLDAAFKWRPSPEDQPVNISTEESTFNMQDILKPIHPIFVIPYAAVEQARSWSLAKGGF